MDKFTRMSTEETATPEIKYDGYIKVLAKDEWEFVKEADMVVCLPYFIDRSCVTLRLEPIPPYNYRKPYCDRFITCVSGSIQDGESPELALRRELEEECGIRLMPNYKIEFFNELHVSKGNTAKYYFCLLPITENDYDIVLAKGDGSQTEKDSICVSVSINNIDSVIPQDTATALLINALKAY